MHPRGRLVDSLFHALFAVATLTLATAWHPSTAEAAFAAVSGGITVSPGTIYASPAQTNNFSTTFTLRETQGGAITFTHVAMAILRSDNTYLFDVGLYTNVTVPANGTWTFPETWRYLAAPGAYKAVARGRYNNGAWFDFGVTGTGVNPRNFTVQNGVATSGRVTSARDGAALGGCTVTWGPYSTTTDGNGNYAFNALPCQTATFQVSLGGYHSYSTSYGPTCNATNTLNVSLSPWGYASVWSGVTVSPSIIYPSSGPGNNNFSVDFMLRETTGFPITFAEVGVAILDGNNNYLFDLAPPNLQNVTVPANGTWTYPTKSGYLVNPGTYKAVVRGHVSGGSWFDFSATGGGANPAVFTVRPLPTPSVSVSPPNGVKGTLFSQPGTGFTPNSTVELHFRKPPPPGGDGLEYPPPYPTAATDGNGNYSHSYNSASASMFGTYEYWAVDLTSGVRSNTATYQIFAPITPSVSVTPGIGIAGTVFSQPGSGFTPNGTVELHFRKPPPPGGDGLEYPPPYPTIQADGSGNYQHTYNSSTASMFGTYQYWAIDLTTGTQSNIASFQLNPPPQVSVTPSNGAAGTVFSQPGSGFTPGGSVELHFRKPPPPGGDGLEYPPPYPTAQADGSGNYSHSYNSASASMFGTYQYWAIDLSTGISSNTASFQVTPPLTPTVSVNPLSAEAGTIFSQPGSGFTPNSTVELHFRKPPPPYGDGLEYAPPYPMAETDAAGNYSHTYNSSTASMFGTYQYWAIDLATGARSNTANFQVVLPCTPPWTYALSYVDFSGIDRTSSATKAVEVGVHFDTGQEYSLDASSGSCSQVSEQLYWAQGGCTSQSTALDVTSSECDAYMMPFSISNFTQPIAAAEHLAVADYPLLGQWPGYPDLRTFLVTFAPVLKFNAGERYRPVKVDVTLRSAKLVSGPGAPQAAGEFSLSNPTPDDLAKYSWQFLTLDQQCEGRDECYSAYQEAYNSSADQCLYATAIRDNNDTPNDPNDDYVVAQYWMNYFYNDWEYCPVGGGPRAWALHQSDWEHVSILFDTQLRPQQMSFKSHSDETLDWNAVSKWQGTNRPIVYVSRGAHGNFARPGTGRFCETYLGDDPDPFVPTASQIQILPRWAALNTPTIGNRWIEFAGYWGRSTRHYDEYGIGGQRPGLLPGSWRGPAFRTRWLHPVREEFKIFRVVAHTSEELIVSDALGRTVSREGTTIPMARYDAFRDGPDEAGPRVVVVEVPMPLAGQYNINIAPPSGSQHTMATSEPFSLVCTREWVGAPTETIVLADNVPIESVPPGGFDVTPDIPHVGFSRVLPAEWDTQWPADDMAPVEWHIAPAGEGFDVSSIVPESLKLNGVTTPVLSAEMQADTLIVRFARGAAVRTIQNPEVGVPNRLILTGTLEGSSLRLESPAFAQLVAVTSVGPARGGSSIRLAVAPSVGSVPNEIQYSLPTSGRTLLRVLDVTGRVVAVLVDRFEAAGKHRTTWDHRNSAGHRVRAGVYFVDLGSGVSRGSARIVVLN